MDPTSQPDTAAISDAAAMQQALHGAHRAGEAGEVPVGAVIVHAGRIVGRGHNTPIADHDPSAHAEINALREAARELGNYRLDACTLYVTLEPCIMCAGAILNARIGRVVFGAPDPKAGAAGSVVDLFADRRLNHRTEIQGGVLADESRAILQGFFRARRSRRDDALLPDNALRTPDAAFDGLPDYPWPPLYVNQLPALGGLRMHYVDAGPRQAKHTWLCLHGSPLWSYAYRHMISALAAAGQRVIAPDLPGFGKSDKPKRARAQLLEWYTGVLHELVEHLDLQHVILVGQGLGSRLAARLPARAPLRHAGVLLLDAAGVASDAPAPSAPEYRFHATTTQTHNKEQAWTAPFPNAGFKAAIRACAALPPLLPEDVLAFWQERWQGKSGVIRMYPDGKPPFRVVAFDAAEIQHNLPASDQHPLPAWLGSARAASAVVDEALAWLASD
ncbi:MAG: tRNA adenosine(34) deaminase TadA [Ottowia sp.]|nr:tRNA adenosine(34) deaminase TadA [Ottowia sp.]